MSSATLTTPTTATRAPLRSVGVWLSIVLVLYMLFNAYRAFAAPADFAAYYGVPLAEAGGVGFVHVYAIRAVFLAAFGAALLIARRFDALALFALVATVMPVGDALLVASSGAPAGTTARHVLTAVILLTTWFFLRRWLASSTRA